MLCWAFMLAESQHNSVTSLTIMQVLPALKVGGVERGTIEFAIYLKQQGHKPIVVSSGGPLVGELEAHQITHITLNVSKKSFSSLLSIKKLHKLMVGHQVDVVHARSRLPAWLCFSAIKRIKRKNNKASPGFVTTLHGLHSVNRYSSIMARGDAVIAVSETAARYLKQNFKAYLKAEPVLIYRGVDAQFSFGHQVSQTWLNDFNQKTNAEDGVKTVLMPGRLTQIKGVEHLISWLKSSDHAVKLLLTADAEESNYSRQVQQLFHQHHLSDRLVWLGIQRRMADLYASVDLVVSVNNKAESFGRTVLEALSVGTPVVAFAHGGVAEVMSELYPAGQVKAGDDEALAERIDAFLLAAPKVQKHAQFSNLTMFEKTTAVYQQLLTVDVS